MSEPRPSDDPELRALLDSIGVTADHDTPPGLPPEEQEHAERMLARILSRRAG